MQTWISRDGSVALYNADSLEMLPQLKQRVDMVFTDPPYGMTDCEWDRMPQFERLWDALESVCVNNAPMLFTASQPFTSLMVTSNQGNFKTEWIWRKNAGSNVGTIKWHPMKEHESVLLFCRGTAPFYPQKQRRAAAIRESSRENYKTAKGGSYAGLAKADKGFTITDGEMRCPSSVQYFDRERGIHPNQKPVALCDYFIRTYSLEGQTVLDPFSGSASTLIACMRSGRRGIGYELNADYFRAAVERLEDEQSSLLYWSAQ